MKQEDGKKAGAGMIKQPPQEYDPNCKYLGKKEFARDTCGTGGLKEVHVCRNKRCSWTFCEAAFKARSCPEQEVMPP